VGGPAQHIRQLGDPDGRKWVARKTYPTSDDQAEACLVSPASTSHAAFGTSPRTGRHPPTTTAYVSSLIVMDHADSRVRTSTALIPQRELRSPRRNVLLQMSYARRWR
jgi:hypothetical protein